RGGAARGRGGGGVVALRALRVLAVVRRPTGYARGGGGGGADQLGRQGARLRADARSRGGERRRVSPRGRRGRAHRGGRGGGARGDRAAAARLVHRGTSSSRRHRRGGSGP